MNRRFFAPAVDFQTSKIVLGLEETRHLRDVLRLRTEELVRIFDGEGKEFLCEIVSLAKRETALKIIKEIPPAAPESELELTLAVALLKGEKFDLVVQKAVELGVSNFIPLLTKRTDVKPKDAEKKLERWRKIILEASKQYGPANLMKISAPAAFDLFVKNAAASRLAGESHVLFSERGGENFSAVSPAKKMTAVTGAEGGWENSEIEFAGAHGFRLVTFGGRILRAETAAIAAAAVLQNRFGDLN